MIFLLSLGAVLVVAVFLLNSLTLKILRPERVRSRRTPGTLGISAEEIEFSSDGRTLRGWCLAGDSAEGDQKEGDQPDGEARPLIVLAHGWGANAGAVLPLGRAFNGIGLDVLAFDFRHHGRSDSAPRVTILDYSADLDAAVVYARKRFPNRPIVLAGHSIGGAAAVLAVAKGTYADGLLIVASPASFFDVTARYLGPGFLGVLLMSLTGPFFFYHVRKWWTKLAPHRYIGGIDVPISIVHGASDDRVPLSHTHRLARAAGVQPLVLEDTGHLDILHSEILHAHALDFVNSLT